MISIYVTVSFFDSLSGGAGLESVDLYELADWLEKHPGYLVRKIVMPLSFAAPAR